MGHGASHHVIKTATTLVSNLKSPTSVSGQDLISKFGFRFSLLGQNQFLRSEPGDSLATTRMMG